jgi:hypothetical protein
MTRAVRGNPPNPHHPRSIGRNDKGRASPAPTRPVYQGIADRRFALSAMTGRGICIPLAALRAHL